MAIVSGFGQEPETVESLQGIHGTFSPLSISGLFINGIRFYKGIIYSKWVIVGVFTLRGWLFLFLCHCKVSGVSIWVSVFIIWIKGWWSKLFRWPEGSCSSHLSELSCVSGTCRPMQGSF